MKSTTERKRTNNMDMANTPNGETESNHGDDISSMQIQALRNLFLLLVLAVAILVVVSSLAVLRKPKLNPNVNVYVGLAMGNDGDDSARLKRGVEIPSAHAAATRGRQLNNDPVRRIRKEKGKHKTSPGFKHNTTLSVNGHGPKGRTNTHGRVDIKHGPLVNQSHKRSENDTRLGRRPDRHTAVRAVPATRKDLTSSPKLRTIKYNSTHLHNMRGRHGINRG